MTLGVAIGIEGNPTPDDLRRDAERFAMRLVATSDYFSALGIDIVAGRPFTSADHLDSPRVVLVSEQFARVLGIDPHEIVGRRTDIGMPSGTWAEIVGVVRDVRMRGPERDVQAAIYLPFAQAAIARTAYGIIQSTAGVDTLVPAVRDAVARIDPDLPLYNIRLFHDIRSSYLADRRLAMQLMSLFGLVALALAVVGVYGAIRYLAQRRTREIGIRMALGAWPGQVARRVFADGALPVASGVALGSAAAVALSGVLAATVPGTTPADIRLMIVVAAAVAAVALVAAWLPARSTARVDPVAALRSE